MSVLRMRQQLSHIDNLASKLTRTSDSPGDSSDDTVVRANLEETHVPQSRIFSSCQMLLPPGGSAGPVEDQVEDQVDGPVTGRRDDPVDVVVASMANGPVDCSDGRVGGAVNGSVHGRLRCQYLVFYNNYFLGLRKQMEGTACSLAGCFSGKGRKEEQATT